MRSNFGFGLALIVAFGVMAFGAAPVHADAFLDFTGPPGVPGSSTSKFVGDWASKDGTLTVDDAIVTALVYLDGSSTSLIGVLLDPMNNPNDAALQATVEIIATFDNGNLDPTAQNTLRIFEGGVTYYYANIYAGHIGDGFGSFDFSSQLGTDSDDPDGLGLPVVDTVISDWFAENAGILSDFGASVSLLGRVDGTAGSGPNGVTNLNNIIGKLEPVPEPGTLALVGMAAAGIGARLRRRRKA